MADSLNQQIADALVERHLRAGRVETALRHQVWEQLRLLEDEILSALKTSDPTELPLLARRRREIQRLMDEEVDPLITLRYARLGTLLDEAMGRLAVNEAHATERIVNTVADEPVIEETPPDTALKRRVAAALFPTPSRPTDLSTTGSDWWVRQGTSLSQRLGDSLLVGVSLEESLTQLTQRVRGTSENGFKDGIMAKAKDDAARLLTTQVTNAIGEARRAVGERNAAQQLIAIHVSILDSKTSMVCLGRNGLKYSLPDYEGIGHSIPFLNGPPYHPNCRSSITISVDNGGAVAQETTAQWLRRKGSAFQDEILGPTRGKMFRNGTLGSPRNLIDAATGQPLTLEELGA